MSEEINITMSAEDLAAWNEYQAAKKAKQLEKQKEQTRLAYRDLVDEQIAKTIKSLESVEKVLQETKKNILDDFKDVLDMKENDLMATKVNQRSHTFTHSNGLYKIKIGYNVIDEWLDTADDGIQLIKDALKDLATDNKSKILVEEVLNLLSKDANGNLDKRKVLQLEGMALKLNNDQINEGLKIIRTSYTMSKTKLFIYAARRNEEENKWVPINLSMTNASI